MGSGPALAEHGGVLGLHRDHLQRRVALLQILACAGDGPAGAHARHKDIHLTAGVLPDLRAGAGPVGGGVGGVDELAGDKAVRYLPGQLLRLGDGPRHALGPLGEDQLRAVGLHQQAALHAHGLRHGDDDAVALGRRHRGQANPRVARGGLDNHRPRLQLTAGLSLVDHRFGDAVLRRPAWIEILQLRQDAGVQPQRFPDPDQLQQRRAANQLTDRCVDFWHYSTLPFSGQLYL